ncbi:MAG: fibronectin type III domain-containing protein, partial [Pedosphaera sp.]|nr:fibronectin type III domain-containing protein [Pedosphaera sp.]
MFNNASNYRPHAALATLLFSVTLGQAHVGPHPSVHDTVAGIIDRFRKTVPQKELLAMSAAEAKSLLTEKELHILATEHVTFRVNVPVKVIIIRDADMGDKPFWLKERDFKPMGFKITIQETAVDFWLKDFEAGRIGLGVNSLTGGDAHYIVALMPLKPEPKLEVTELYPGQLRVGALKDGIQPFVDRPETLPKLPVLPGVLAGLTVIRTQYESRDDAKLINLFRNTNHPALAKPDQVTLTWSGDPQTTQSIQWRTGPSVPGGQVQWVKKSAYNRFQPARPKLAKARTFKMEDANLMNDPVVHRHTVALTGLEPGTAYLYSVGDGSNDSWSEMAEFTTAPGRTEPFSFVYMGDAQNGLDRWGSLVQGAFRQRPDAA